MTPPLDQNKEQAFVLARAILGLTGWISSIPGLAALFTAVLAGGTLVWKFVKKTREDGRKARAAEEVATLARVAEAVERVKAEMAAQIEMAKTVANHWKEMAGVFEKEKNHERELFVQVKAKYEEETERLRAERNRAVERLEELKVKHEEVLDLNLGYQGQITENARRLSENERKMRELQEKVQDIDGLKSGK